ncbi:MAG TPA: ABC transporter permease [Cyclobacteriaceae bacterium]
MKKAPPQRALRFLRWFCREDYIEEIEGDLTEIFEMQYEASPRKARLRFAWSVIRYFRPEFIKAFKFYQPANSLVMIRHNLLIAYRNFLRYKGSFFINLIGLSSGLACALLIYLWVSDELQMDKFHEHRDRLYQVLENVNQDGKIITRFTTAGPTAEALVSEMPEVEYAATATYLRIPQNVLSIDDRDVSARCLYASEDFLKMFSFRVIHGNRENALADKKAIVLTEDVASRLFETPESAIGKTVMWQHEKEFQVTGVIEDIPEASSIKFDFILTFEEFKSENDWVTSWGNTAPQTFVLFKPGTDVAQFNAKIADLVRIKTEGHSLHRTPFVTKYSDLYLYGNFENGVQSGGRIEYVRLFSIVAIFILLIACINFMNLSTARASRRMKEVGMKKAVGARRGTLVVQYLSESTFIAFLALLLALLFVVLLLPQFNLITEKQLSIALDLNFVGLLSGIVLITGLTAGSYPALYLSKFSPLAILKGRLNGFIGEAWARKGLVVFQFSLSVILIVGVWVVYRQIRFIQTQNLGYDRDNVVLIPSDGPLSQKQQTFLTILQGIPGVAAATSGGHDMTGHNGGTYGIEWPGKNPDDRTEFERMAVRYGFIEALGIEMLEGRTFSRDYEDSTSIIFNEAAIKFMGMTDPLGKTVKLWGRDMTIIGVTKNFHFETFRDVVKPAFFWLASYDPEIIMVRIQSENVPEVLERIQAAYEEVNPGFPFTYRFLDDDYQAMYAAERRVAILSRCFAGLAVLISCLGLFGLAAFTAERRTKEIGIRKVLGSSSFSIVRLLSAEYTKMVLTAIVIALPVSYYAASTWLDGFVFKAELEWWMFAGAGLAALIIAWVTVGLLTMRAASVNPADCLRSE